MLTADRIRKVLIVKPSSLGDIVHSLPVLAAMRRGPFAHSEIHWAVFKGLDGILDSHPMIDKLVVIDKRELKSIAGIIALWRRLRAERYDMTVDLQGLLRSGLISWATGAPVRVGFMEGRERSTLFYTLKVIGGTGNIHAVDRYMKIAAAMGCPSDVEFPLPHTDYNASASEYAVLVPGARWDTKIWPPESFGALAAMLPIRSVIVGSRDDSGRAGVIASMSGGKAIDLTGKTSLKELCGVIKGARFMVTNDSGPMHIAAAYGVQIYAIFGPTSPERTGPYGKGHTVIKSTAPCAPCFKKKCSEPICMTAVKPETVLDRIKPSLLAV